MAKYLLPQKYKDTKGVLKLNQEETMSQSNFVERLKSGFQPSFWVANGMELFERLAYYGQATILSVFLRDHLKFTEVEAGQLSSIFGGLIYLSLIHI